MSNHSGSYMLNAFLHRLAEMGILKDISAAQKRSICDFLLHWGERLLDDTLSLDEVFSSSGRARRVHQPRAGN